MFIYEYLCLFSFFFFLPPVEYLPTEDMYHIHHSLFLYPWSLLLKYVDHSTSDVSPLFLLHVKQFKPPSVI